MEKDERRRERARVNPAARRDAQGEPHDDLVSRDAPEKSRTPKPYQEEPLDPRDPGGIAE